MKEEKLTELTIRLFEECRAIYDNIQYRGAHTEQLREPLENICQIVSEIAYWARFRCAENAALQAIRLAEELLKAYIANDQALRVGEQSHKQARGGDQG